MLVFVVCVLSQLNEKEAWSPSCCFVFGTTSLCCSLFFALVQVIVGSFMYGGSKKNKAKAELDMEHEEVNAGEAAMALPEHNMPPHAMSGWASWHDEADGLEDLKHRYQLDP